MAGVRADLRMAGAHEAGRMSGFVVCFFYITLYNNSRHYEISHLHRKPSSVLFGRNVHNGIRASLLYGPSASHSGFLVINLYDDLG